MAQNKKGLLARILENKEMREEHAKNNSKISSWQLFWNIFRGNFKQVMKANLWILLFFLPTLVVIVLGVLFAQSNAVTYPFGANLGVGYPAMPDLQGVAEWLTMQNGLITCMGILISAPIASVGLAGGMYVVRNMVRGKETFKVKEFFYGVKLNYKDALQAALFFCVLLLITNSAINLVDFNVAMGTLSTAEVVWLRIAQAVSYVALALSAMTFLWMIALGVNYKQGFFALIKNAFLMTLGTLIQTVFFGVIAVLPFALFLLGSISIFVSISLVCLILFSFTFALLVWLVFAQWVFDQYITPKQQRKSEKKAAEKKEQDKKESRLTSGKVKPLDDGKTVEELPKNYTRKDLKKTQENKKEILAESDSESKTE